MLEKLRSRDSGETDQVRQRLADLAGVQLPAPRSGGLIERWLPGGARVVRRRTLVVLIALLVVVAAIVTAVLVWWQRPAVEHLPVVAGAAVPSAVPAQLVVSVVGKVARPGLVTLPEGARVADALRAAGGPVEGVDLNSLNLARKLTDGEQVPVGLPAEAAPEKVDLNSATEAQLQQLPGVGPTTAKRILQWRKQHGRFQRADQLREVDGIGNAKFARLKDLVRT